MQVINETHFGIRVDGLEKLFLFTLRQHAVQVRQFGHRHGRESNKGIVVHPRIQRHEELTVHTIHDTTVPGYQPGKVFDTVRTLNSGCEKAAKGCDDTGKESEPQSMNLNWNEGDKEFKVMVCVAGFAGNTPCEFLIVVVIGAADATNIDDRKEHFDNWIGE